CGVDPKAACTVFFGGSEGFCNIVEGCWFEFSSDSEITENTIGIMISEGDYGEGLANRNHVFRKNVFKNYAYGILIGSHDDTVGEYGHIVEYNVVDTCSIDGIMVKCGDTQIRGNRITNCKRNSISVIAGKGSVVVDNRVEDSSTGITVKGIGHTVQNNCIIHCPQQAIELPGTLPDDKVQSENIFIEQNTCIDCGSETNTEAIAGVHIRRDSSCIVRRNLFHGKGKPYVIDWEHDEQERPTQKRNYFIDDNLLSGECESLEGTEVSTIEFASVADKNYHNSSGYGARGWVLDRKTYDPDEEEAQDTSHTIPPPFTETQIGTDDSPADDVIDELNEKELYKRSLLFNKKKRKER
ncbi:MAG: hypothetical protein GF401_07905, partial [Chitinivibrionales bacterium]|nr:hypothetical protein [Chitinivibrionales bacterium]